MAEIGGPAVRVLIVSEDPLAREGLAALLTGAAVIVVGHVSAEEAGPSLAALAPEVVIWDPGLAAAPLPAALEPADGGPALLVLVPDADAAAEAWAAGARGVLARVAPRERLAAAVRALSEGLLVADGAPPAPAAPLPAPAHLAEELTRREQEALQLLAQGLTNRAIALRLGIAERTAKFHVNAILAKLGAANRSEAIVLAHHLGLIVL